jgi:hypothetical protein
LFEGRTTSVFAGYANRKSKLQPHFFPQSHQLKAAPIGRGPQLTVVMLPPAQVIHEGNRLGFAGVQLTLVV